MGLALSIARQRKETLLPGVWFGTALLVHLWHRPFWHLQFINLSVPMAWLAGIFVGETVREIQQLNWEKLSTRPYRAGRWVVVSSFFLAAFLVDLPGRYGKAIAFTKINETSDWKCVKAMKAYQAQTRWVFADDVLYPFHAGLLVPPEIAVVSNKRFNSGALSQVELLNLLAHYRAEQVVMHRSGFRGRWNHYDEKFRGYVGRNYSVVHQEENLELYVRNDLVKAKPETATVESQKG